MSTHTTNYNLVKPDYTDKCDVGDMNDNADIIDENLKRVDDSATTVAGYFSSEKLKVANGGTGMAASPSLLVNLASTSAANVFAASPRPGVTGKLPLANGGTNATDAAGARSNLGLGGAATCGVANNATTSSSGYVLDARQGKAINDNFTYQNNEYIQVPTYIYGMALSTTSIRFDFRTQKYVNGNSTFTKYYTLGYLHRADGTTTSSSGLSSSVSRSSDGSVYITVTGSGFTNGAIYGIGISGDRQILVKITS